jgi:ATP-dependent helicase/DNAse subunit B
MKHTLQQLTSRFENMERTLKSRSVDQGQYLNYLEDKIRMLKALVPQDAKE